MNSAKSKFIKVNKFFLTICAYWASVNVELSLPTKRWLRSIDRLTQIWSLVILLTSLIKFFKFSTESAPPNQAANGYTAIEIIEEILILNYLPQIGDFAKLYFGLVCITIGAALAWRYYLNIYRPNSLRTHKQRLGVGEFATLTHTFNAKNELIEFYMNGPSPNEQEKRMKMLSQRRHANAFERLIVARHVADNLALKFQKHPSLDPASLPRLANLLTRVYQSSSGPLQRQQKISSNKQLDRQFAIDGHESDWEQPLRQRNQLVQIYRVPIRSANFLHDHSELRWNYLFKLMASYTFGIVVISVILFYYTIVGLCSVQAQFASKDPNDTLHRALLIYGTLEQIYACTQASMFFAFTNMFVMLFMADLTYKIQPIRCEIDIICELYKIDRIKQLPRNEIHRQRLRLWAYFDNVLQLDGFVSKYSIVSMTTLVIGLSLGQSYLRISDPSLKVGTGCVLLSNFLSFTYLHVVSWLVERKSTPIHKAILSILARESDHEAKRDWQKSLIGFFAPDWKRAFTLGGRYPLNLQSYFKTVFGLATISLVINRLFIKRALQ